MPTWHGLNLHIGRRQESLDCLLTASYPVFIEAVLSDPAHPVELNQGSLEISRGVEGRAQRLFSSNSVEIIIMMMIVTFFSEQNLIFKKIYNEGKL